jgi:hypothetical protein
MLSQQIYAAVTYSPFEHRLLRLSYVGTLLVSVLMREPEIY